MAGRVCRMGVMVCVLCGLARAGEPEGAPGRFDAVTLYHGHAAVVRVVDVPAGKGMLEVVVTELPERVAVDSLHADGSADVQIRAVSYRERTVHEAPRAGVEAIDAKLAALAGPLRENQHAQELILKKLGFMEKLGAFTAQRTKQEFDQGALKTEELSKLALFVFEQHDTLGKQLYALAEKGRALQEGQAALQRQRAALTSTRSWLSREAVLFLEKAKEAKTTVRFGYLVEGVEWRPSYSVRSTGGLDVVAFEYNASVQQMSGESWRDVKLTLSTATPTLAADPPVLAPFQVTLDAEAETHSNHDVMKVERERHAAEQEFRAANTDESRQRAQAAANTAAARLNVLYFRGGPRFEEAVPLDSRARAARAMAVSYPLEGRHSIESRPDFQTIPIRSLELDARFYRRAEPTLTRYVYRQAQMVNTSDVVFLRGKANAYVDGKFAGVGSIPVVRPGQRFTAGFGVDTRLRARQTLIDREQSIQGGNRELVLTYAVRIENFSDAPLAVRVLDRYPVPAAEKLSVSLLRAEPALSDDEEYVRALKPHNFLRWDVEAPAGANGAKALTIHYQFKVGFDKTLQISASRTITPLLALVRPLEPWQVETAWSNDGAELSTVSGKLGGPETITVNLKRGKEGKNVVGRRMEGDLTGFRWLILDLDNQVKAGVRVAVALSTGKGATTFESTPNYVRFGKNQSVVFDLTAPNFKTEANKWEYGVRLLHLDQVRGIYLVFYPTASGAIVVNDLKLAR